MSQFIDDTDRGLYGKYKVERIDGSSEFGQRHHGCSYFVLDMTHDPHAAPALLAYADSCEESHPLLARDLRRWAASGPAPDQTKDRDDDR